MTRSRTKPVWWLVTLVLWLATIRPTAQERTTLSEILERAGVYVLQLERDLSGVVSEEHYVQDLTRFGAITAGRTIPLQDMRQHRDLRSDVLLVRPEGFERYVQFRDVFEVDGTAVRDRDDRLARLFLSPAPTALEQLMEIREDSSRYNLGDISRDLNVPVLALIFLHPEYQSRFTFTGKPPRAGQSWEIDYQEVKPETLIRTTAQRDLPVRGRFRLEPGTGRVLMSELVAEDDIVHADVTVTYELATELGFYVPTEMKESVGSRRGNVEVKGRATYTRFRRFQINVDEKVDERSK